MIKNPLPTFFLCVALTLLFGFIFYHTGEYVSKTEIVQASTEKLKSHLNNGYEAIFGPIKTISLNEISIHTNNLATKFLQTYNVNNAFSPVSLSYTLSVLHTASSGVTKNELSQLFGGQFSTEDLLKLKSLFETSSLGESPILMRNYLAINNQFSVQNKTFLESMSPFCYIKRDNFSDQIPVSFKINRYFNNQTDGMVFSPLRPLNPNSVGILVDALIFKSHWRDHFVIDSLQLYNFTSFSGKVKTNRMIQAKSVIIDYFQNNEIELFEIPYSPATFSLGIVLTKSKPAVHLSTENLSPIGFSNITLLSELIPKLSPRAMNLRLPRMKQRKTTKLISFLNKNNIKSLFTPNTAQFPLIGKGFYLSEAIHETMFSIDEYGSNVKNPSSKYSLATLSSSLSKINNLRTQNISLSSLKSFDLNINEWVEINRNFLYYIRYKPLNMFILVGNYDGQ